MEPGKWPAQVLLSLTVAVLAVWASASCAAEPNKEQYELQERCGKRAQEFFERRWGDGIRNTDVGYITAAYESNYYPELNRCFILMEVQSIKFPNEEIFEERFLYDPNTNKVYGSFIWPAGKPNPTVCNLSVEKRQACSTVWEWNALVAPYIDPDN